MHIGTDFCHQQLGDPPTYPRDRIQQRNGRLPAERRDHHCFCLAWRTMLQVSGFWWSSLRQLPCDALDNLSIEERNLLLEKVNLRQMTRNQKALMLPDMSAQGAFQLGTFVAQLAAC